MDLNPTIVENDKKGLLNSNNLLPTVPNNLKCRSCSFHKYQRDNAATRIRFCLLVYRKYVPR